MNKSEALLRSLIQESFRQVAQVRITRMTPVELVKNILRLLKSDGPPRILADLEEACVFGDIERVKELLLELGEEGIMIHDSLQMTPTSDIYYVLLQIANYFNGDATWAY